MRYTSSLTFDMQKTIYQNNLVFAQPKQAEAILYKVDDYVLAMHPSERALAMKSAEPVSQDAYLRFLADNVLAWTGDEREKLTTAMRILDAWLDACRINAMGCLILIKTTEKEMYNCAYTRSNAIILPESKLQAYSDPVDLAKLLAHEYFHILTRTFPGLRSELYRLIGFHPLDTKDFAFMVSRYRCSGKHAVDAKEVIIQKIK